MTASSSHGFVIRHEHERPHADFAGEEPAIASWVVREHNARPLTSSDALLVAAGQEPERLTRAGLVTWLRDNRLHVLARRAERREVPHGSVIVLLVGDEAARLRVLRVRDLDAVGGDLDDEQLAGAVEAVPSWASNLHPAVSLPGEENSLGPFPTRGRVGLAALLGRLSSGGAS